MPLSVLRIEIELADEMMLLICKGNSERFNDSIA